MRPHGIGPTYSGPTRDRGEPSPPQAVSRRGAHMRARRPAWTAWALAACLLASMDAWAASDRVALVFGNAAYSGSAFAPLVNAAKDAKAVAAALKALGFEVVLVENGDFDRMNRAIDTWGDRLVQAKLGFFYYAGHGFQFEGENWLVPVGTTLAQDREVKQKTISLDDVVKKFKTLTARDRSMILVLDACRTPPPLGKRGGDVGWAAIQAPVGTFVAFATAPGQPDPEGDPKASNGPYAKHLLKRIATPNLQVEDLFKRVRVDVMQESDGVQQPWDSSSLSGTVVLCDPQHCGPRPPDDPRCSGENPPLDPCLFGNGQVRRERSGAIEHERKQ